MKPAEYQTQLIKDLAQKHSLPVCKVEEIVYSQSALLRQVMEDGNNEGVRFPYFGVFEVSKKVLRRQDEIAKRSRESAEDNG